MHVTLAHPYSLRASLLVALSAVLYGFLGYLGTKVLRNDISINTMLFWRFFIAGIWMIPFLIKKHVTHQILNYIDKRIIIYTFILGAIGYAGSSGFYFLACLYTGTGLSMVIFFSYPIIIALISWLTDGKILNSFSILSLILMSVGLILLSNSSENSINWLGIFFGITAAICYAGYVMVSKQFSANLFDSNVLTITVCLSCASVFLMLAIFNHDFSLPTNLKTWYYILALGILATAVPIQLMLEGLKHVSSVRASIISVLEPLITVFVGVLGLHESISHLQYMGALIITVSAILIQFQKEL